jgi:hypothetical protein
LSRERIRCCELYDIARRTNHDLAFEWELPSDRLTQSQFAHLFTDNERADGANVNDTKLGQLLRDKRWLAPVRSTDVDCTKKYNPAHRNRFFLTVVWEIGERIKQILWNGDSPVATDFPGKGFLL